MQRAHTEDPLTQFICGVRTALDPAIVLACDSQVNNMVLSCASSTAEFCVLTIDPTFSLGEFNVTPITYRHLLLKSWRSNTHPIFLRPLLIHCRKRSLHICFSLQHLLGCVVHYKMSWHLAWWRASTCWSIQSRVCFITAFNLLHSCEMKDKFHIPSYASQKILDDFFGAKLGGVLIIEDLVDASGDDYF